MDNAAGQTPAQRIPALKAESETLDTELFAAYQAKLVTKEERSQEDARIKRAREEHDRLLVCSRRKEDARRSLERLGEDEEHDRLKMAIMRKKIELECTIQNIAGRSVSADIGARAPLEAGRLVDVKTEAAEPQGPFVAAQPLLNGSPEAIVAEAPRGHTIPSDATAGSSTAGRVADNGGQRAPAETTAILTAAPLGKQPWNGLNTRPSLVEAMKRAGEARHAMSFASSVAGSAPRNAVPLASSVVKSEPQDAVSHVPSLPSSMRHGLPQRQNEQPRPDGLHPSRLALHSGISPPSSQSPENGASSGLHLKNAQLAHAASANNSSANNANDWLDNMIGLDRKRKASTDAYDSPPLLKRIAFGPNLLEDRLAHERALHSSHATTVDIAGTTFQFPNPHIIPRAPKAHFTTSGIRADDLRRMLNCTQGTEVCFGRHGGPVLVLSASAQVHAPAAERADGVYYTLLGPATIRSQPFPVLVREPEGDAVYQYVGEYAIESVRLLKDGEVDNLGVDVCRELVREDITKGVRGQEVVRSGCVGGLLRDGVVRTENEAVKTTVDEFARRMKTIKLSQTFTGKPTKRLNTFAHKLVFRGFEKGYFQKYIERPMKDAYTGF